MGKMLTVLAKLGKMKPNGVDISKYCKAAAQVLKDCMEQVSTGGNDTPDSSSSAAESGTAPADVGSTGPPAAAAPPGQGAPAAA
jgi:hypothetical protein